MLVILATHMQERTNRRIVIQASLGIKQDPVSKIASTKRTFGIGQVIAHLSHKHEALISTPSTTKKQQ
jgi:hypothetical protein